MCKSVKMVTLPEKYSFFLQPLFSTPQGRNRVSGMGLGYVGIFLLWPCALTPCALRRQHKRGISHSFLDVVVVLVMGGVFRL